MIGFSLINTLRNSRSRVDHHLRQHILSMYKPMRWLPCFMHKWVENGVKRLKKVKVIVEFHGNQSFDLGIEEMYAHTKGKFRSRVGHHLPTISACSAHVSYHVLEKLLLNSQHIKKIHFDRPVRALLNVAGPTIHADVVNQRGDFGKGVTVAIVDTGIAPHQDLTSPTNRIIGFKDFINGGSTPYDDNGHGTHCAGDALGNGSASGGKYKGMAPEANVVGVKVLDSSGAGDLSTIIAGVDWCIQNKNQYNIRVISMSLGSPADQSAKDDPMVQSVEKAWDAGIVVVVAAGNEGPDPKTIGSPATSAKVISVGAMDDKNTVSRGDDTVADFSSRGPTIDGFVKPDVLAPGVNIISLRSPGSLLDKTMKSNRVETYYFSLSGTSMATPIVAGVVALIIANNPSLTPDQVKDHLLNGAEDRGYPPNVQGRGYIDVSKSL